jgi:hypothetical protein
MLGSSSASHSVLNGFDEKKKASSHAIKLEKAESKQTVVKPDMPSRVKERKTSSSPASTATPTKSTADIAKPSSRHDQSTTVSSTAPPPPPPTNTTTTTSSSATTTSTTTAPASRPSEALASKMVPGTTLRCLEDPSFMFDPVGHTKGVPAEKIVPPHHQQKSIAGTLPAQTAAVAKKSSTMTTGLPKPIVPSRGGSIQVLEAPSLSSTTSTDKLSFIPPAPVTSTTAKRSGVGPGASQVSALPPSQPRLPSYRVLDAPDPVDLYGSQSATGGPGGKNKATDVIEKARNRFDKFWGKSKDDDK